MAVIPARGGSKRVPRKNIRCFAGRPIISWVIETARTSGFFDRVIVSTDDEEIAALAQRNGAEVPFLRPKNLSGDYASTAAVMAHAIDRIETGDAPMEAVCCLYPTAALVTAGDLLRSLTLLLEERWEFVFPAVRFAHPIQRGFERGPDGETRMLYPEHRLTRSQDLPPVFHDTGQFYWGIPEAWRNERPILGERATFIELPPWRVQDIDTLDDWLIAEGKFEAMRRTPNGRF